MSTECKVDLTLTSLVELSEAVAEHVKPPGIDYMGGPCVHVHGDVFDPFCITDPRHWMMVVDAMREQRLFCERVDRPIYAEGGMIHVQVTFAKLSPTGRVSGYARNKNEGIAVGIAALQAKGFTVNLELED